MFRMYFAPSITNRFTHRIFFIIYTAIPLHGVSIPSRMQIREEYPQGSASVVHVIWVGVRVVTFK
jgi:hypothetical protein